MTDQDKTEVRKAVRKSANMTPARLTRWLESPESRRVGWKGEDGDSPGESVGHPTGRRIVAIKRKRADDLTEADYAQGDWLCRPPQRPEAVGQIRRSDGYSLMNWGHDPLLK